MSLLAAARDDLDREFHPAGYNIGINDGAAAVPAGPDLAPVARGPDPVHREHRAHPVGGLVLHQNLGEQASAISLLVELREEFKGSRSTLAEARRAGDWKRLAGQMRSLLKEMPLGKLQRVGHEDVHFLYEKPGPGANCITLLPGVACHLRERAPLIRRLAQTEWLQFVLSLEQNRPMPGSAVGLSEFLFGSSRVALSLKVSKPLRELQDGRCFYCQRSLPSAAAVAEWSYGFAERVQAEVWLGGTEYGHLSSGWRELLSG